MSRGLSRNQKISVKLNIDSLIQYTNYLKSKIYKAYILKEFKKIYDLQSYFVKSPLVIYLSLRKINDLMNFRLTLFELGYIVFFFNLDNSLISSFFQNYRNCSSHVLKKQIFLLVTKAKYYIISWLMEVYIIVFFGIVTNWTFQVFC